jgi:hypothetical protein
MGAYPAFVDWGTILASGAVAIVAAAMGGVIGAYGALKVSKADNAASDARAQAERAAALSLSREERFDNRRRDAYVEIAKAVRLKMLKSTDYIEHRLSNSGTAEELVIARAFALFGTSEVQGTYDNLLFAYHGWLATATDSDRGDGFGDVVTAANALERQIAAEMSLPASAS